MAAQSKELAKDLLDELDRPKSDEHEAYEARKEDEDREALEQFYRRTGQVTPDPLQQAIAALAERIEEMPPGVTAFEAIEVPLTITGRKAMLRFAVSPAKPDRRFLDLTVWSASGLSTSAQWLSNGSGDELIAHLRRPEMAADIRSSAEELIQSLDRHRLA
jgi:hypothetical protein